MQKLEQRCQRHPAPDHPAGPFVFGNGFGGVPIPNQNPTAYPRVGFTSDGIPVHQDGVDFRTEDRRVVVNIRGQFFYYDQGRIHDGQGHAYDAYGTPLQPIGQLADGNPVYHQPVHTDTSPNRRYFILRGRATETVIQLRNGHFAYAMFNLRYAWENSSHTTYFDYFFDGQDWFGLDGKPKPDFMEWQPR
jgi:hypothetical protein